MKIFRKLHGILLTDNLLPSPQDITQDMLTQVLKVEQGSYSHPWQLGNFVDSIVSGYHMPVWWQADELLCYLVAMRGADEVHLLNFTVASDHQRQGLAQAMMRYLREWSMSRGVHSIWLEVRASNHRAIGVYLASGFVKDGVRPGYYPVHNGQREDAVVMSLSW
jgi:ribosomal-protein-alanine N-acetyltransferase